MDIRGYDYQSPNKAMHEIQLDIKVLLSAEEKVL